MSKLNEMINAVTSGKDMNQLVEVQTTTSSYGTTTMISDKKAKFRSIVEPHFKVMAEELEKEGLDGFRASVDEGYASISIN